VLAEIIMALDTYRDRNLNWVRHRYTLRPMIVTNGTFTRVAQSQARERDVELISEQELCVMLDRMPCTPGEVEAMEARRLASMRDLRAAIEQLGNRL